MPAMQQPDQIAMAKLFVWKGSVQPVEDIHRSLAWVQLAVQRSFVAESADIAVQRNSLVVSLVDNSCRTTVLYWHPIASVRAADIDRFVGRQVLKGFGCILESQDWSVALV